MSLNDALIITGLGLGVVFTGLILTNLLIYSFSFFSKLSGKKVAKENALREAVKGPEGAEPPAPEVLAVIAAVLETELILRGSLDASRFTFK